MNKVQINNNLNKLRCMLITVDQIVIKPKIKIPSHMHIFLKWVISDGARELNCQQWKEI